MFTSAWMKFFKLTLHVSLWLSSGTETISIFRFQHMSDEGLLKYNWNIKIMLPSLLTATSFQIKTKDMKVLPVDTFMHRLRDKSLHYVHSYSQNHMKLQWQSPPGIGQQTTAQQTSLFDLISHHRKHTSERICYLKWVYIFLGCMLCGIACAWTRVYSCRLWFNDFRFNMTAFLSWLHQVTVFCLLVSVYPGSFFRKELDCEGCGFPHYRTWCELNVKNVEKYKRLLGNVFTQVIFSTLVLIFTPLPPSHQPNQALLSCHPLHP